MPVYHKTNATGLVEGTWIIKRKLLKQVLWKCIWLLSFTVLNFSTERAKIKAKSTLVTGKDWDIKTRSHSRDNTHLSSHITSLKFHKVCVGPVEFS